MSTPLPVPYLAIVFVAFSSAFWALGSLLISYNRRRRVITQVSSEYDRKRLAGFMGSLKPLLQDLAARLAKSSLTNRWLEMNRDRYGRLLLQAGKPGALTPEEFLSLKAVTPFVVFLILFCVLQGEHLVINVVVAGLSFLLPDNWLREQIRNRVLDIEISLSDALDAFALMMQAGLDLGQAIASYVDDPERTAFMEELALMTAEVRVGKTRAQALAAMAQKINSTQLSNLVTAMSQAEQSGVSLAGYLAGQAEELRLRRFTAAEEQGQKAPLKMMAPLMLLIMPCVFLVLFGPMFIAFRS